MPLNVPILLTWLRIALIPLVFGIYYLPDSMLPIQGKNIAATVVFTLAALTDWFDGWLARRWNETSQFGAFLDPVADKLMVVAALLMLLKLQRVNEWIALVIIGREIAISALREWMAQIGATKSVAVHGVGKIKTGFQMVAIPMLFYDSTIFKFIDIARIGDWLIVTAALLTIASMLYYLKQAWPQIASRTS